MTAKDLVPLLEFLLEIVGQARRERHGPDRAVRPCLLQEPVRIRSGRVRQ